MKTDAIEVQPEVELQQKDSLYATPRVVTDLEKCAFYHCMDIPGYGTIDGPFDLRGKEDAYLGNVDFNGKRVLEIGPASGVLTLHMEKKGADVVAYDLSPDKEWDVVPFQKTNFKKIIADRSADVVGLNNAFWLSHRANESKAKVVYGTVYEVPKEIGPVDISTFSAVLVHFRDPFLALESVCRLTTKTVVITEMLWRQFLPKFIGGLFSEPRMVFLPKASDSTPWDSWWFLSPKVVKEFVKILGFEDIKVTYHRQKCYGKMSWAYTVVANRTVPLREE